MPIVLDPRTKLLVFLMTAIFVLGSVGGVTTIYLKPLLTIVPFLLFISARKWKTGLIYIVVYALGILIQVAISGKVSGIASSLIILLAGSMTQFLPTVMMGYFVVYTTTVSEFIASMERMHVTPKITIPLSVMFRFFPTVKEELDAINDAMKMRGISFRNRNIVALLEYKLIPMMICSVKIGEELSQASLTRGLGSGIKRTNVCEIGFHAWDYVVMALCAVVVIGCIIINVMTVI